MMLARISIEPLSRVQMSHLEKTMLAAHQKNLGTIALKLNSCFVYY